MDGKRDSKCGECPYNQLIWVEEISGYICKGLLHHGDCYMARLEEAEW